MNIQNPFNEEVSTDQKGTPISRDHLIGFFSWEILCQSKATKVEVQIAIECLSLTSERY